MRKTEYKISIYFEKATRFYVISAKKKNKSFVTTQGKTFTEAFKMLGEAIKLREDNE